jgi:hypothetical protein
MWVSTVLRVSPYALTDSAVDQTFREEREHLALARG